MGGLPRNQQYRSEDRWQMGKPSRHGAIKAMKAIESAEAIRGGNEFEDGQLEQGHGLDVIVVDEALQDRDQPGAIKAMPVVGMGS
jgi:hypothetical protein